MRELDILFVILYSIIINPRGNLMIIQDSISFDDITVDGIVTDSKLYKMWSLALEDGVTQILADIGVDDEDGYDEWLDTNEDDIYDRLAHSNRISADPCSMEQEDIEETIHDVYLELAEMRVE